MPNSPLPSTPPSPEPLLNNRGYVNMFYTITVSTRLTTPACTLCDSLLSGLSGRNKQETDEERVGPLRTS